MKIYEVYNGIYGWWVLPDGDIVEVEYQGHHKMADQILSAGLNSTTVAKESGWMRLNLNGDNISVWMTKKPTRGQISSLIKIESNMGVSSITIESFIMPNNHIYNTFMSAKNAMQYFCNWFDSLSKS